MAINRAQPFSIATGQPPRFQPRSVKKKTLAQVLALLATKAGEATSSGTVIPFRLTHQDIAAIARVARQTATIALGALEDLGLIKFRCRQIIVPDVNRLWDLVDK